MAYQRNLGVPTQADVTSRVDLTWSDISSQALTQFKTDLGGSAPYPQAILTSALTSRTGPGTAYAESTKYNANYVLDITGQFGNWLQTAQGDYIPVGLTADYQKMVAAHKKKLADEKRDKEEADKIAAAEAAAALTDTQIKNAIATAVPVAIQWVLSQYRFTAVGITPAVVTDLVKRVKDNIVTLVMIAMGAAPQR